MPRILQSKTVTSVEPPEIEVTPEMIEAGLSGLYGYSPDRSEWTAEETTAAIYRFMERARLRGLRDRSKAGTRKARQTRLPLREKLRRRLLAQRVRRLARRLQPWSAIFEWQRVQASRPPIWKSKTSI